MNYKDVIDLLPIQYYLTVLSLTLVYILLMVIFWIILSVKIKRTTKELSEVENELLMHQGCQIENLPLISSVFETTSPLISSSFKELIQGSADYFHKRWIPNPIEYINSSNIINKLWNKLLKKNSYILPLIIGLFISFGSFFGGAIIIKDSILLLWIAAIPFTLTILSTLIMTFVSSNNDLKLQDSIDSINKALRLKLPVFSENAGVSLLVTQFIEYDRNMSKAVETLTEKIEKFTDDELVNAISSSIQDTLREDVFPSIERTNEAILSLANDIAAREDEGMKSLALNFASSVTSELAYHLKPIATQVENLAHTISDSKNYIDVISSNINIYKKNAEELHSLTTQTIKDYEESRMGFSSDLSSIASSLKEYDVLNKEFMSTVSGDISIFENSVKGLRTSMEESDKTLKVMLDAIFVEARTSEENAGKALESASSYIYSMKDQIQSLTTKLSEQNKELISELDTLMSGFLEKHEGQINTQQGKLSEQSGNLLTSMEESANIIKKSSRQIKESFDELEEARRIQEENSKKSFFKRK